MSYRFWRSFLTFLTLPIWLLLIGEADTAKKPNIVLILADDFGWREVGFMGSSFYETPRLDRLAAEGLVFTNAYAPSANCAPSRACLLTGLNTPRHGMYTVNNSDRGEDTQRKLIPTENVRVLPSHLTTIADLLKGEGYKTAAIGKWHISSHPQEHGFDVSFAGNQWGHPKTYWAPFQVVDVEADEGEYLTDLVTDEAIRFIEDSREGPFFLYLPFFAVHDPLQGKPNLVEKYKNKPRTDDQGRYPDYASMIENMDTSIGKVVDALGKHGLSDDTIIIFTSDNGGAEWISDQTPLRAGKGAYYEGGIRVPFVIHNRKLIPKALRTEIPITGLDLFPTLAELAGVSIDNDYAFDGESLVEIIQNPTATIEPRPLYWHFPIYLHAHFHVGDGARDPYFRTRPGSIMRFGEWKLHEYFEDGELELYNLKEDLEEAKNLVETHPEKAEELHAMMKDWRAEMRAPVPEQLNLLYDSSVTPPGYEYNPEAASKYVSDQSPE